MSKRYNKKKKIMPESNQFDIIQKSLDERESDLILQFQMVNETLEWAAKKLDVLIKEHKILKKNPTFLTEEKTERLERQIGIFLRQIDIEQKNGRELQKKETQFKKDKELFILSQLGNRLSNIINPINPT
jgi:hypothetical protein